jgi:hypothetical protein
MKTSKKRTSTNKTSKRKNKTNGGGWFWNDSSESNVTTEVSSNEPKKSWGSWVSGLFSSKKPEVVESTNSSQLLEPLPGPSGPSGPLPELKENVLENKGGKKKTRKSNKK